MPANPILGSSISNSRCLPCFQPGPAWCAGPAAPTGLQFSSLAAKDDDESLSSPPVGKPSSPYPDPARKGGEPGAVWPSQQQAMAVKARAPR